MPTTPLGFTYPGPLDPPAGNVQMQQLAESADAYLQTRLRDTGWTQDGISWLNSFTPASPASGWAALSYRLEGRRGAISGVVQRGTAWGVNTPVLALPATALPSRQAQSAVARLGTDGQLIVTSAGSGITALFIEWML